MNYLWGSLDYESSPPQGPTGLKGDKGPPGPVGANVSVNPSAMVGGQGGGVSRYLGSWVWS